MNREEFNRLLNCLELLEKYVTDEEEGREEAAGRSRRHTSTPTGTANVTKAVLLRLAIEILEKLIATGHTDPPRY